LTIQVSKKIWSQNNLRLHQEKAEGQDRKRISKDRTSHNTNHKEMERSNQTRTRYRGENTPYHAGDDRGLKAGESQDLLVFFKKSRTEKTNPAQV